MRERAPEPAPTRRSRRSRRTPAPDGRPTRSAGAPEAEPPAFDVVRVEPDGSAVVAGTAAPGAQVTIYADDAPLAQAEADAEGNFVAIFEAEPSAEPQALTLGAATPDGGTTTSDDVVMLLPTPPAAPRAGRGARGPATPAPGGTRQTPRSPEPEARPPSHGRRSRPRRSSAPDAVEVTPAEAGRVAAAHPRARSPMPRPARSTLAGLGTAGALLRAYVDERFAARGHGWARTGAGACELGDVAQGVYSLRIDQLGPDGEVASRVETPFQRDFPPPPRPRRGRAGAGRGRARRSPCSPATTSGLWRGSTMVRA